MAESLSNFYQLIWFRDQVKESLGLGELSNDATIGEIHNLKTERSYYRGILDHLCDRLQLWANGFERLKDVRIVKTSEPENLAIDNRRPCSFSRRVNVLLDDNPDEILTVLGDDQMLARIEKMYNDLTAANEFRDQVKFLFGEGLSDDETIAAIKARRWDQNQSNRFVMAIKEVLNQGKLSDDEAIAKIKELSEQSQLLGEITDILNKANTECLDHYRSKQEEKIVLTGFRGLCDIHAALLKKRSEYEIYGSRIIDDLLNSEDPQAQKQAYDQEEIQRRIDKAERESFDSLREFYFALAEMLGVNNDKEMIAKIKELAEIKAEIALGNIGVLSNLSYEFRSQIKQALYKGAKKDKYPSIDEFPDDDAISFVEHLIDRHKHWERDHEFTQFALEVKQLLIDSVGKDISNEEAITEIKRLQANNSATYDPFQDKYKLEQLTGDKDREIKRLNGDISGIASFLNLPSDAKQPDICFAIMELKQEKKKYYKGYFQLEVISKYLKLPENCKPMDITTEVIELKEELDQAKKVIARLVGE